MSVDHYELVLVVVGAAALAAAWLPAYTARRPLSLPIVLVAFGAIAFALPIGLPSIDPRDHLELTERLTELVVIVSLMGAGLKIDRPFRWRTWSSTWRMLLIAMPITIVATALLGWAFGGLAAATAALLGSALAPTDPVLASDVQVGEPTLEPQPAPDAEDDVRFTLTSEGGLNDALAFPFVYGAIALAGGAHGFGDFAQWFGWDVLARVAIGAVVGVVVGRLLGRIAFEPPGRLSALSETPQGFVAIAATLLAYGGGELLGGYGFLAVFVAAVTLRGTARSHAFHTELHRFSEQTENVLVVALLLLFGGALVSGLLGDLTVGGALVAVLLVFVVRPISGFVALVRSPLSVAERGAIAFFGVRGFGSVYYVAYACSAAAFAGEGALWSITALAILISIAMHGITATPMMDVVDRTVRRRDRRRAHRVAHSATRS